MKFIRKNGRIIPIKDKKDSPTKEYNKTMKEVDKKDKKATKIVVGAGLVGALLGKKFKSVGVGALIGATAGSIVARAKGLAVTTDERADLRDKRDERAENLAWEKKKKAYKKMDKLKKKK